MNIDKADKTDARARRDDLARASAGLNAARHLRLTSSFRPPARRALKAIRAYSASFSRAGSRRASLYFVIITALLAVAVVIGIAVGSMQIAPATVLKVLGSHLLPGGWVNSSTASNAEDSVVWLIRTPRVFSAALVGAALAIAGAQMQGLFQNPLASPDIIGTSSGGALGAVLALATGLATRSLFYIPVFSFVGALVALFVVYGVATQRGRTPIASLLLAGVALNAMISAATTFLITMTWVRLEVAQEIIFWLLGGLDSRTWEHVWFAGPLVALGILISLIYSRDLDLLLMGEDAASSLGVEVEHVKRIVLTSAALLTGAAVAISGVVGFVGLIVPHVVRLLIGPAHRQLIPASALTGAAFLILADLLARTLHRPEEIRLGIITAVFGAPFFLYLLMRRRREIGYL
ncbi:MAG TPA: iron ABC transporter permease [Blastocatellia bacterium]|jgi:iron complex transport system permease protein|nr:iron ABC transporter permease [Blastocatellia bacterium]